MKSYVGAAIAGVERAPQRAGARAHDVGHHIAAGRCRVLHLQRAPGFGGAIE